MMCRKAAQIDAAQGEGGQSLCAVSSWSLSWATPFLPELGDLWVGTAPILNSQTPKEDQNQEI